MVSQLLIFGIWLQKCSILPKTNPVKPMVCLCRETRCVTPHQTSTHKIKPRFQLSTTFLTCIMLTSVPSNVKFSQSNAMLYVFEDNETVTKMIIKGRSPTMRHVSRTRRVALDWLVDRINLDLEVQIRYIDTTHQLADTSTEGNFTRDEWNNIFDLFNISHISSLCCAQNFSVTSCTKTMVKRMQEQKEDNRIVAKSKPMAMNLAVTVSTSSSSVNSPIASKSPGILKASSRQIGCPGKPGASANQSSNRDVASSSQGWLRDAQLFISQGDWQQQTRIRSL